MSSYISMSKLSMVISAVSQGRACCNQSHLRSVVKFCIWMRAFVKAAGFTNFYHSVLLVFVK